MHIALFLLFGLVVGAIARFLVPGKPGGWVVSIVIGGGVDHCKLLTVGTAIATDVVWVLDVGAGSLLTRYQAAIAITTTIAATPAH